MTDVTPQKLREEMDKGTPITIVDLQETHDYEHSHIPTAVNVPFDVFKEQYAGLLKDKDQVIVVYGIFDEKGQGSTIAPFLESEGYTKVGRIVGGLMGWKEAGYPAEGGSDS